MTEKYESYSYTVKEKDEKLTKINFTSYYNVINKNNKIFVT